jgi:hypothetical protein
MARAADTEDVPARLTARFESATLLEHPDPAAIGEAVEEARRDGLVQLELQGRAVLARVSGSPARMKAAARAARERGYLHIARLAGP